jgi:hypothetical protein
VTGRVTALQRFEGVPEASLQFEPDTGNHPRFRGSWDIRSPTMAALPDQGPEITLCKLPSFLLPFLLRIA